MQNPRFLHDFTMMYAQSLAGLTLGLTSRLATRALCPAVGARAAYWGAPSCSPPRAQQRMAPRAPRTNLSGAFKSLSLQG